MAIDETPIFGRKVFFLNPPYAVKRTVIEKLHAQEYETYYIDNYRFAKSILRKNRDSICFINIDGQLSIKEWFNFVKSFEEDEVLSTVFVGILSQKIKIAEKNQFLLKTNIPGGFIMLNEGMETITEKIIKILQINNAKGRRKYVRLRCKEDSKAMVHVSKNNHLYDMQLRDISSVGFACILSPKFKCDFVEKEVLKSILIDVTGRSVYCDGAIYAIKEINNQKELVVLFMRSTSQETRNVIRDYVFATLQKNLNEAPAQDDETNYSIAPENIKNDVNSKFMNDEEFSAEEIASFDDIEDLEEISDVFI